jgi:hypothetical protein
MYLINSIPFYIHSTVVFYDLQPTRCPFSLTISNLHRQKQVAMKQGISTVMLLLISFSLIAQERTSAIRGKVIDKESRYTLPGVNVVILGTHPPIGASTDIDGNYRIDNLPPGRYSIQMTFLGYEMVTFNNLLLMVGKDLEVNGEMAEAITELKQVEITAYEDQREAINQMTTVSARTISIEQAMRFSGSLQDPARMAANFAGVSGANDSRNDIIVRGNSPTGVLWRMEGIDIPSPNHFSTLGTTGGPVSMLNVNNLSNSDFMTGAWSADYGNALSGIFDLRLREGNKDRREYLGQIGFNGFELGAEGPFKKGGKATYLANYRYSTLGVMKALGMNFGTGAAVPEYQDFTFKVTLPTAKAGKFNIWGVGGVSFIQLRPEGTDSNDLYSNDSENTDFGSNTAIAGASHTYFFNPTLMSKLVLAYSFAQTLGKVDSLSQIDRTPFHITGFNRNQNKLSTHFSLNKKFNARNSGNVGIIIDYYNLDFTDSIWDVDHYNKDMTIRGDISLAQAYIQWKHRLNDKWSTTIGVHGQHRPNTTNTVVEPRLGLKFKTNDQHTLSYGMGLHSQLQPVTIYLVTKRNAAGNNIYPNRDLKFTQSAHFIAAHDWMMFEKLRLKTEVYYQYLFNVPVDTGSSSFSMLNEGADFGIPNRIGIDNKGDGYNYGIELTLERFLTRGFYIMTTTSVFESKYRGSDGIDRNTAFNSNYVINALGGKEFNLRKNMSVLIDTRLSYAGGRPYTPFDLSASQLKRSGIRDHTQAFSARYSEYLRWDFKVGIRHTGKRLTQQFSVDLQNLTNRQNVFIETYSASTNTIQTRYQRGFFPDVQYKIYF